MNIYEALRNDHDIQRVLCNKIVKTSGDSHDRKNLFSILKEELKNHAHAEEQFFYNPLIKNDKTIDKARHSIAEHNEIDEKIDIINSIEFSSPRWLVSFKTLKELVEHHLEEEEQEVFQQSGKVLTESQKSALAKMYNEKMQDIRIADVKKYA